MVFEIFSIFFIAILRISRENKFIRLIYFVISSFLSLLLLYIILNNFYQNFEIVKKPSDIPNLNFINLSIQFILLIKLGIIPFHNWIIQIFSIINWKNIFLFSRLNKFISIYLLVSFSSSNWILMFICIISAIFSSIFAIKENSIKKIIGFSSINQTSFFIIIGFLDIYSTTIYFITYIFNSLILINFFDQLNIKNKFNLINIFSNNKIKILYFILIICYGILPLSSFFFLKWFLFYKIILEINKLILFLFILRISRVFITWNYLRLLTYHITSTKLSKKNSLIINKFLKYFYSYIFLSIIFNIFVYIFIFY